MKDVLQRDSLLLSAPPANFVNFPLQRSVLDFSLCLTAETLLPHYVREEAAIYLLLPVAINKFDTTFQAAPAYPLKVSRPSLQIQRSHCQVRGFIR